MFLGLLSVYGQMLRLGDVGEWWHGFFSSVASGPPGPRLRQLLALSRAGLVRFLGPDTVVTTDPARGVFRADSPSVPGASVEAKALVEARLPGPTVHRTRDPLLRSLHERPGVPGGDSGPGAGSGDGAGVSSTEAGLLAVTADDGRIIDRSGRPHPRRFALGPHTDARSAGAFTRPGTNGPAFRQNDATARALLTFLGALSSCTDARLSA